MVNVNMAVAEDEQKCTIPGLTLEEKIKNLRLEFIKGDFGNYSSEVDELRRDINPNNSIERTDFLLTQDIKGQRINEVDIDIIRYPFINDDNKEKNSGELTVIHWWSSELILSALRYYCPRVKWDPYEHGATIKSRDGNVEIKLVDSHWSIKLNGQEGGEKTGGDCGPSCVVLAIEAINTRAAEPAAAEPAAGAEPAAAAAAGASGAAASVSSASGAAASGASVASASGEAAAAKA